MFNWDLNSLVDSAASLVTDAQNDLASWEKRDEASEEAPAPEPDGEHLRDMSFNIAKQTRVMPTLSVPLHHDR